MKGLPENAVKKALRNFGLTEKEAEIYIYLAKKGVQKGGEIAKKTKTAKAVVYRTLKILHRKGFVESTLESPVRFKAVPFETILDLEIKAKHEEARQIQTAKKELLNHWSSIRKGEPESPVEKFVVLEGNQKIYSKMHQMIKKTENTLSIIATVPGIIRSDHYGITNSIINHPLKNKIRIRLLTDITNADPTSISFIRNKLRASADLRGRNPELGLKPFPRMLIRDKDEILFFITPNLKLTSLNTKDTCLFTNCKAMIQAFSNVFENLWQNSINLRKKIDKLEISDKLDQNHSQLNLTKNIDEILDSTKKEIIFVTSSAGLKELPINSLKRLADTGISIRIMAPITNENLNVSKRFSKFCEVKHIPSGLLPSIVLDNHYLFQVYDQTSKPNDFLLVNNYNSVSKTKSIIENLWKIANSPGTSTLTEFLGPTPPVVIANVDEKSYSVYRKTIAKVEQESLGIKNEKDIIREFVNAKEYPVKDIRKDTVRGYLSTGHAIIHPPNHFNLPPMLFHLFHVEKKSSFGREDAVQVAVWLNTSQGDTFVPVVMIGDNPKSNEAFKNWFRGTPAGNNVKPVKRDEIEIAVHGNTMFAAWAVPIPLIGSYVVPPACIIIEGYGNLKTSSYVATLPSGYQFKIDSNGFDAFVTFIHPKSKYTGPGYDGYLARDEIMDVTLSQKST